MTMLMICIYFDRSKFYQSISIGIKSKLGLLSNGENEFWFVYINVDFIFSII